MEEGCLESQVEGRRRGGARMEVGGKQTAAQSAFGTTGEEAWQGEQ